MMVKKTLLRARPIEKLRHILISLKQSHIPYYFTTKTLKTNKRRIFLGLAVERSLVRRWFNP